MLTIQLTRKQNVRQQVPKGYMNASLLKFL